VSISDNEIKKKRGRPTLYTPELADEICDVVATNSCGISTLCEQNPHWPAKTNLYIWLRKYPDFRNKYTQAKEDQVETYVELMQEVLEEEHHYIDENGNKRVDVGLLRVKIDVIKWQAGKLKAKKYGDKLETLQLDKDSELHKSVMEHKHRLDELNKKDY
jgi:Bacteriophage Sf6, terminase small subunit-like